MLYLAAAQLRQGKTCRAASDRPPATEYSAMCTLTIVLRCSRSETMRRQRSAPFHSMARHKMTWRPHPPDAILEKTKNEQHTTSTNKQHAHGKCEACAHIKALKKTKAPMPRSHARNNPAHLSEGNTVPICQINLPMRWDAHLTRMPQVTSPVESPTDLFKTVWLRHAHHLLDRPTCPVGGGLQRQCTDSGIMY